MRGITSGRLARPMKSKVSVSKTSACRCCCPRHSRSVHLNKGMLRIGRASARGECTHCCSSRHALRRLNTTAMPLCRRTRDQLRRFASRRQAKAAEAYALVPALALCSLRPRLQSWTVETPCCAAARWAVTVGVRAATKPALRRQRVHLPSHPIEAARSLKILTTPEVAHFSAAGGSCVCAKCCARRRRAMR